MKVCICYLYHQTHIITRKTVYFIQFSYAINVRFCKAGKNYPALHYLSYGALGRRNGQDQTVRAFPAKITEQNRGKPFLRLKGLIRNFSTDHIFDHSHSLKVLHK